MISKEPQLPGASIPEIRSSGNFDPQAQPEPARTGWWDKLGAWTKRL
jgi:hypothetical protein